MANYGIPYMGSKDSIIHKIASVFPKADNFYDLFGGGFSVTHFMLMHKLNHYKNFIYNEIKSDVVDLVQRAINGEFNYDKFKPPWISREQFFAMKDRDAYIRCVWSFGNNQKNYLFGKHVEAQKRSLHQAVVFNQFDSFAVNYLGIKKFPDHLSIRGRRLMYVQIARTKYCKVKDDAQKRVIQQIERLEQLQQLQQLQQLERLERLQQLEQLERLQRLEKVLPKPGLMFCSKSYDEIEIKPNSIIYCDPPYKNTAGYLTAFDHDKFWDWVRSQTNPVFVSEYQAPSDLKTIMAFNKKTKLSHKGAISTKPEKLFGNEAAIKAINISQGSL